MWICPITSLSWDSDQAWALVMAKHRHFSRLERVLKIFRISLALICGIHLRGDGYTVSGIHNESSKRQAHLSTLQINILPNPSREFTETIAELVFSVTQDLLFVTSGQSLWRVTFFAAVGEIWGTNIRMDYRSDTRYSMDQLDFIKICL